MDQISVQQKEELMSDSKRVFTVKNFAKKNREQGTWPDSESAIWALRAGSPENGFGEGVFISVGRRVLISEDRFWEALYKLQEAKNGSIK